MRDCNYSHGVVVCSFQGALHSAFSRHGLVYDVSLPLSPFNQDPITEGNDTAAVTREEKGVTSDGLPPTVSETGTEYGFVTFYSVTDTKTALQAVQKSPINVASHCLKVSIKLFIHFIFGKENVSLLERCSIVTRWS